MEDDLRNDISRHDMERFLDEILFECKLRDVPCGFELIYLEGHAVPWRYNFVLFPRNTPPEPCSTDNEQRNLLEVSSLFEL